MIHFDDDYEIFDLINEEARRQENEISLIASENYVPLSICQAVGSILTNKYAEGVPGKRFYAGCFVVDQIETKAIERCKKLFGAEHANVQPHSGSQANMAVYMSVLKPGDLIMGMDLAAGGHLTHGYSASFSGSLYKTISYGVDRDTELLDYGVIADLAKKHRPKLIIAGASAYSRVIDYGHFGEIAQSVGAYLMADIAHIAGLVAAKLHPSPVEFSDFVTSTTQKTLCGPRGGFVMCKSVHGNALDKAVMPGIQGGPLLHVIAGKAICFEYASRPTFAEYQRQIIENAQVMANALGELGYRIVSGGTDNHMFIVDLRSHNITGKQAEEMLEAAGITVSRSCIPFDSQKPWITSGIRIGTAALTTRGMQKTEVITIASLIDQVIQNGAHDNAIIISVKERVRELASAFGVYSHTV